jgi:riboflavin transporter FmnP
MYSGNSTADIYFKRRNRMQALATIAMLSALAYVLTVLIRIAFIPAASFLKYEPKDIVIVIGAFIYGPIAAIAMSAIVSFIEFLTISTSGWIGLIMNFVSSSTFACIAALIYKRNRTLAGAAIGLVGGWLSATGVMLLWNWLIVPLYMSEEALIVFNRRLGLLPLDEFGEEILPQNAWAAAAMLLPPVFLPFNLVKYGFNAALAMLIYKPLSAALQKLNILPKQEQKTSLKSNILTGIILAVCLAVLPLVMLILIMNGIM